MARATAATAAPRRLPVLLWLSIAIALLAVAGLTWLVARRPMPTKRMQFALAVPDEMSISHMALSRDGSMLVFVSPKRIPHCPCCMCSASIVERYAAAWHARCSYPFWSPDGAYVAFFANGKLQKMAISGELRKCWQPL